MFRLRQNKKTKEISLVFDIESGSVGGAILLTELGEPPVIAYTVRQKYRGQDLSDINRLQKTMYTTVRHVAEKLVQQGLIHVHKTHTHHSSIHRVLVLYGSPWYVSEVETVNVIEEKPFTVDQKTLDVLIEKHAQRFDESALGQYVLQSDEAISVIEQSIIDVTLNGYPVRSPYGKMTKHLSARVFTGIVPTEIVHNVETMIERICTPKSLTHHAFSLALYKIITTATACPPHFISIDIGEHITDVQVGTDATLRETVSFPYGIKWIIKSIAVRQQVSEEQVETMFKMKQQKHLIPDVQKVFESHITETLQEWTEHLFSVFAMLYQHGDKIVDALYVLCDHPIVEYIADQLKTHKQSLNTGEDIRVLTSHQLKSFCKTIGSSLQREDARLLIATLYTQYRVHAQYELKK